MFNKSTQPSIKDPCFCLHRSSDSAVGVIKVCNFLQQKHVVFQAWIVPWMQQLYAWGYQFICRGKAHSATLDTVLYVKEAHITTYPTYPTYSKTRCKWSYKGGFSHCLCVWDGVRFGTKWATVSMFKSSHKENRIFYSTIWKNNWKS